MRKTLRFALAVAFVLCFAVGGPLKSSAQESLAKLVPDNPVFFKTSVDVEKHWASISGSNFWKQLTALKVWEATGVKAGLQEMAQRFSQEVGFPLSTQNIMSLFGKEVAVALFVQPSEEAEEVEEKEAEEKKIEEKEAEEAEEAAEAEKPEKEEEESKEEEETEEAEEVPKFRAFVLCRTNPKATVEDIVKKFTDFVKKEAGEEVKFKDTAYKGTKITTIEAEEAPVDISYAFIDDVFAFGVGNIEPSLRTVVDLAKGSGNSLADNARFKKILGATRMTTGRYAGCFYADFEKVGQLFSAMEDMPLDMPMQMMVKGMKQAFSAPVLIGGTTYVDRGLAAKMVSLPTGETTDELIQMSLATPPAKGAHIAYIPENAIFYLGVNNMPDVEKVWPLLQEKWEEQGAGAAMTMILGRIENMLGIKIAEDVIPWVGSEFAGVFTDLDTKAGFPYPKFAGMVKIKDKGKANAFLTKLDALIKELSEQTGFKSEKVPHKGYNLKSVTIALPMPIPVTFTPCYGVVEDFLIVGSSADLVKQMIDTSKGDGKDLSANEAFKALNMPTMTNSVAFFNWGRLMDVGKATAAWVVEFSKSQPTMAGSADSIKAAVDNYVVPIANVLSALQSIGGYEVNEGNTATATYIIRVKDLPGTAGLRPATLERPAVEPARTAPLE